MSLSTLNRNERKEVSEQIGKQIAEILNLKPDSKGNYPTLWGTKSNVGLTQVIDRIITEKVNGIIQNKVNVKDINIWLNEEAPDNHVGQFYTFKEANKVFRRSLDNKQSSDMVYSIQYDDGYIVKGIIDCEPSSFWDGEMEPLTQHLKTFFVNVSEITEEKGFTGYTPEDIEDCKKLVKTYMFTDK